MNRPPRLARSLDAFTALQHAAHGTGVAAVRRLEQRGLTPAQFQLLVRVQRHPEAAQQDHADAIGVTKANVSQLLGRLQQAGLVSRHASGRRNAVELTPAGQALLAEAVPEHDQFVLDRFADLDDTELATLTGLLARIETG